MYVSATIYGIYGCYCEETSDGNLVAREYVIDADDYYYMGMRAEYGDMDAADELEEASWEYFEDGDYTKLESYQYEVKGTINSMPSDSLRYYHEALEWSTLTSEEKEMYLPYYLEINTYGTADNGDLIIMGILFTIFFLMGLVPLLMALTGHYQKSIKQYIARSGNPEWTRQKIDAFIENTPEINSLRYNHEFICGQTGPTTTFGETSKLAWAYLQTTNHKRYFITVGHSYALMLGFADGHIQSIETPDEATVRQHLQNFEQFCPQAVLGYSDDLSRLFHNNLYGFLNLRYNQVQAENNTFEQ